MAGNEAYQVGGWGQTSVFPFPIVSRRAPTSSDIVSPEGWPYPLGQIWFNNSVNPVVSYLYYGAGVWIQQPNSSGLTLAGNLTLSNGNISLATAGNKLNIATGTNASIGTSTAMVAGTITVNTTAVTANSLIFLTVKTPGGTQGILSIGTITPGTSFVINSSSNTDTSTVQYLIIN